ncbi:beta-induced protein ig-h3 [Seminavis robusta]|uniref:Beta-induced protein ig-h3 n=1 Tax=Seminavis robusta TaxID=568900 RepID=A0A9N8H902_9STRA|nr:beta-induced protein ig-h3 [Seminavis robusta]|eukprot:Sro175_g076940.1 beta-induced protein ig-h3 (789) ;mRNA; f:20739-23370
MRQFLSLLLLPCLSSVKGAEDSKYGSIVTPRQVPDPSILDIASENEDLQTLVSAVQSAGLVEALGADGPLTLFAPTDQAFEDAGVDFLLEPQWILHLQSVLLYHVAAGSFLSDNLAQGEEINSLYDDEAINVTAVDPLIINDAPVITPNITASNGVIHVIDQVLFPAFTETSVVDIAAGVPETFSTLVDLLDLANLTETLADDEGIFTVFAPTNQAFAALDQTTLEFLMSEEGADALESILLYHVVPGIAYSSGVEMDDTAVTLEGSNITVTEADGDTIVINGVANLLQGDILARNGVIHIIDSVLAPAVPVAPVTTDAPDDSNVSTVDESTGGGVEDVDLETWVFLDENYSTFYSLLNMTDLPAQLTRPNPLTLMAPDNDAFEALPGAGKYLEPEWYAHLYDILLYHIVPGELLTENMTLDMTVLTTLGENFNITSVEPDITINNISNIVDPDIVVSNGVAHGIDAVLLPPSAVFDIVDIVVASPFFEELLGLIVAAGLDEALRESGPFTIFAPTNNAINTLDQDLVASLTTPEGLPQLRAILEYHIVPGILLSDEINDGDMVETAQGSMLTLNKEGDDTYFVNGADIFDMDILASNGVIHVVNRVLIPPEDAPMVTDAPETDPPETMETGSPTGSPTDEPVDVVVEAPIDTMPVEVQQVPTEEEEEQGVATDGEATGGEEEEQGTYVNGSGEATTETDGEDEDETEDETEDVDSEDIAGTMNATDANTTVTDTNTTTAPVDEQPEPEGGEREIDADSDGASSSALSSQIMPSFGAVLLIPAFLLLL